MEPPAPIASPNTSPLHNSFYSRPDSAREPPRRFHKGYSHNPDHARMDSHSHWDSNPHHRAGQHGSYPAPGNRSFGPSHGQAYSHTPSQNHHRPSYNHYNHRPTGNSAPDSAPSQSDTPIFYARDRRTAPFPMNGTATYNMFHRQVQYLDALVESEARNFTVSDKERAEKLLFRRNLEQIVQSGIRTLYPNLDVRAELRCYGSFETGFAVPGSDIDLFFLLTGKDSSQLEASAPRLVEKLLLESDIGARLIERTRVPILKICQSPSETLLESLREERSRHDEQSTSDLPDPSSLEKDPAGTGPAGPEADSPPPPVHTNIPPKKQWQNRSLELPSTGAGILCDINFTNPLALENTTLLRCYSTCDPRVARMIGFVKAWAKRRKINAPYRGTLSSYGYALMVLHYLMNIVNPPVIPNLQFPTHPEMALDRDADRLILNGYDATFFRDEEKIKILADLNRINDNDASVGVLLRGFFHYYAHQGHSVAAMGFNWIKSVVSIRTLGGHLSKESKNWLASSITTKSDMTEIKFRYLLAIEDPFETDHNVGRTVTVPGVRAIRDEFRRAWWLLEEIGMEKTVNEDLLDEIAHVPFARKPAFAHQPTDTSKPLGPLSHRDWPPLAASKMQSQDPSSRHPQANTQEQARTETLSESTSKSAQSSHATEGPSRPMAAVVNRVSIRFPGEEEEERPVREWIIEYPDPKTVQIESPPDQGLAIVGQLESETVAFGPDPTSQLSDQLEQTTLNDSENTEYTTHLVNSYDGEQNGVSPGAFIPDSGENLEVPDQYALPQESPSTHPRWPKPRNPKRGNGQARPWAGDSASSFREHTTAAVDTKDDRNSIDGQPFRKPTHRRNGKKGVGTQQRPKDGRTSNADLATAPIMHSAPIGPEFENVAKEEHEPPKKFVFSHLANPIRRYQPEPDFSVYLQQAGFRRSSAPVDADKKKRNKKSRVRFELNPRDEPPNRKGARNGRSDALVPEPAEQAKFKPFDPDRGQWKPEVKTPKLERDSDSNLEGIDDNGSGW